MARTSKFREQHVELLQLASELGSCLNERALADDATRARACLSKLMGKLVLHLGTEDKVLYPELSASKNPSIASLAKKYAAEMQVTSKSVVAYSDKWRTPTSIKSNPAAFMTETRQVIRILGDRIKRENQELYAAADQVEGRDFG